MLRSALSLSTKPHLRAIFGGVARTQRMHASSYFRRRRQTLPVNMGVNFVPQQEAWVIERFGKFHAVLEPGLRFLIPFVDRIKYVHSLKEIVLEIPSQSGITQDNVTLHLDGVLYMKIMDPYKASYGAEDVEYAVAQLAQTTMRSELGKLTLDTVFKERQSLNAHIVESINQASIPWGVVCLRCEIRDIMLPDRVVDDMQRQVSAERKKRAAILESEGTRMAAVNVAEGQKQSVILSSEAVRQEQINQAQGEASAIRAKAEATARALKVISEVVQQPGGKEAVALQVASQYIEAFGNIAKETNTVLLPASASDPASMMAQAMTIFNSLKDKTHTDVANQIVDQIVSETENGSDSFSHNSNDFSSDSNSNETQ